MTDTPEEQEQPAALLQAVPGWRAVLLIPGEQKEVEGVEYVEQTIKVVPIDAWAFVPSRLEPDYGNLLAAGEGLQGLFGIFGPPAETQQLQPSYAGKILSKEHLHRLVPPSKVSDSELIDQALQKLKAENEKILKRIKLDQAFKTSK